MILTENDVAFKMQHQINNYIVSKDGCWIHRNKPTKDGYIRLDYKGLQKFNAHRLSYVLYKEKFDTSLYVLHTCDIPPCINPDHLFLGTQKDNINDMYNKGRGVFNGSPQLTEDEIGFIKVLHKRGLNRNKIAKIIGVDYKTVTRVLRST